MTTLLHEARDSALPDYAQIDSMTPASYAASSGLCDCVVMLTWSDWKTEPRSNRYHYATRLSRKWPVLFVQPDGSSGKATVEPSGSDGIQLVHVWRRYDRSQSRALALALNELGYRRPMLWVYNPHFSNFVALCHSPLKVFHATEDYFVEGGVENPETLTRLRDALACTDLLIAVSPLVREHYLERGGYAGETLLLPNGCDYAFWADTGDPGSPVPVPGKVALYQGGINARLDWQLLERLLGQLPDWEFRFCGRLSPRVADQWRRLKRFPNLRYLGELAVSEVRRLARDASVGIIPYLDSELISVSLPLKAFEYAACGLPVVSTPIKALEEHPTLFRLASNADGFAHAMAEALRTRFDHEAIAARRATAKRYDYDARFSEFESWLARHDGLRVDSGPARDILVLYDAHSTHVNTIDEHLRSFRLHSRHRVRYAAATGARTAAANFSQFDAVVVHYSVRVNLETHLSPANVRALREYPGLKVLFMQDEYDTTETARRSIERLGIHIVYTCVPEPHIASIYPPQRFPSVEFVPTLTGFVPLNLASAGPPMRERGILIGYRGRNLPYWYGDLAREKLIIGQRMKEICAARNVPADIEWDDAHRIYGPDWYRFLQRCKATLGTESGSNLFDDHGSVRAAIERSLQENPAATYEQLRPMLIAPYEGKVRMNQVSPRIFEAIACRTALVLFEGDYSGVVKPGLHFIALKKDFSNADEVLERLHDDDFLEQMADRAFRDVIESGHHSYRAFVGAFDGLIDRHILTGGHRAAQPADGGFLPTTEMPLSAAVAAALRPGRRSCSELFAGVAEHVWYALPSPVRSLLRPLLNRIRNRAS